MLPVVAVFNAVVSHAMSSGHFEQVNTHEGLSALTAGLRADVWVEQMAPVLSSGLASTSMRLELSVRGYSSADQQPSDQIDPALLEAMSSLYAAYIGDFTLDGLVRMVDVRGAQGEPMRLQSGYVDYDGRVERVMTISLPLIINDVYEEVA